MRDSKLLHVSSDDYPPSKAAKKGLKKLQGVWKVASAKAGDKEIPPKIVGFEKLRIEGRELHAYKGNSYVVYGLTIDPAKKPATIDLIQSSGAAIVGVFEINGKKLRICLPPRPTDKTRPTILDSSKGLLLTAEKGDDEKK